MPDDGEVLIGSRFATIGHHVDLRRGGIVIAFASLFVVLSFASDSFLTLNNLLNVVDQYAPLAIIAIAATLVLISGNFDLSVGAIFAFSGVVAAQLANSASVAAGLVAGCVMGAALGLANGMFVTVAGISSFIATLATGIVISSASIVLTGGELVSVSNESFAWLGQDEILGVKVTVALMVLVCVLGTVLLTRTVFGRRVFAVGGSAEAAKLAGVRTRRVVVTCFVLSGLAAGLAGVIAASRVGTGQADSGTGLELQAIAAVVIGGTSIHGGEGAVWRTVLGVLLLAMIGNGFTLLGVNPIYGQMVQGGIILLAVTLDVLSRRR